MRIFRPVAEILGATLYVLLATLVSNNILTFLPSRDRAFWALLAPAVLIIPIALVAGYFKKTWQVALIGFWVVNIEFYVAATVATPGESLLSGASSPNWVTAVVNIVMFGLFSERWPRVAGQRRKW